MVRSVNPHGVVLRGKKPQAVLQGPAYLMTTGRLEHSDGQTELALDVSHAACYLFPAQTDLIVM